MYSSNSPRAWTHTVASALFIALTALSCREHEEITPADTKASGATILFTADDIVVAGIPSDGLVWNILTLSVTAPDHAGIESVTVSLDSTTIVTHTTPSFSLAVDTQPLEDGPHTLTIVARDSLGGQQARHVSITVRNILLSINIPADIFSPPGQSPLKGYILLSDEQGEPIVVQEYHPGDTLRLRAPGFDGASFYVTELYNIVTFGLTRAQTFCHVERGPWVISSYHTESYTPPNYGSASVNFSNAIPGADYSVAINSTYQELNTPTQTTFGLYGHPYSRVFITRDVVDPVTGVRYPTHYGLTSSNIAAGLNPTIDLSQVNQPTTQQTVTTELSVGTVGLWGVPANSAPNELFWIGRFNTSNNTLQYAYPGNAFASYYHEYYYEFEGEFHRNNLNGLPDGTALSASFNLAITDNDIEGTVTGTGVDAYYSYMVSNEYSLTREIFAPPGTQQIIFPRIPTPLPGSGPKTNIATQTYFTAVDYAGFDGYDGLKDYIRNSTGGTDGMFIGGSVPRRTHTLYPFWAGGSGRQPSGHNKPATQARR